MARTYRESEAEANQFKMTHTLANDDRPTLVMVDKELYALTPYIEHTYEELRDMKPSIRPHVRILNPISHLSRDQQAIKNKKEDEFHELYVQTKPVNTKVTSIKKAMILGKDVPEEVHKLIKEKEAALKAGDTDKAKKIRKILRKLDYKRYMVEE